jgi:hypothetical protein
MTALQDAVPEDVREKMTAAVSGIFHTQGTHLKFDGRLDMSRIPDVSSGLKAKIQEKVGGISGAEDFDKDHHSSDQIKRADELADSLNNTQPGMDKPTGELESDLSSEKSPRTVDLGQSQSASGDEVDISGSVRKDTSELWNNEEKPAPVLDYSEKESETGVKLNFPSQAENAGGTKEATVSEHKDQDGGIAQIETKEENNNLKTEEKSADSSTDQSKVASARITEEVSTESSSEAQALEEEGNDNQAKVTEEVPTESSSEAQALEEEGNDNQAKVTEEVPTESSSETQAMEEEGNENQKRDNKSMQLVQDQAKSIATDPSPPTFSVSQALDALTEVDDSTQVAVNSVFGVIENMITHLEEGWDEENGFKDRNNVEDTKTDSVDEKHSIIDPKVEKKGENEGKQSMQSGTLGDLPVYNHRENSMQSEHDPRTGRVEEETKHDLNSSNGKSMDRSWGSKNDINVSRDKNEKKDQLAGSKLLADNPEKLRHVSSIPLYITANPNGASFPNKFLRQYLISKKHTKSLDVDTTTALLLDYFPEEGQWKLLEQPGNSGHPTSDVATHYVDESQIEAHLPAKSNETDNFIEPPYVIFDTEKQQEPVSEYETIDHKNSEVEISDDKLEELMHFVNNIVTDSLMVEVGSRLTAANMKEMKPKLARDVELLANAVSLAVGHDKEHIWCVEGKHGSIQCTSEKLGTLHWEHMIRAISSAVQDTSYLRRVLPIGVIVGSSLAALRKSFNVATVNGNSQREVLTHVQAKKSREKTHFKVSMAEIDQNPFGKSGHSTSLDSTLSREKKKDELKYLNNNTVMVGAVTAALGASALLVKQVIVCLFFSFFLFFFLLMISYFSSLVF